MDSSSSDPSSSNCSRLLLHPEDHNDFNLSLCGLDDVSYLYGSNGSSTRYTGREKATTQHIISLVMELLFATTFLGGVIGNLTVLYVVARFSKVKSVTNFYIVNLALSDLLFLMGIPFLITTYINEYWLFGNLMCKLYLVNTSLNQFTSSLFLTIMSADRYVAVCHPISSPKYRTSPISKLVSLTAWTVASLMIAPVFMYATTLETPEQASCNMFWPTYLDEAGTHMFTMYSFVLSFALPLLLIFSFYSLVIWKLRSSRSNTFKSQTKDRRRPKRSRVTRLVMALIAVYIICWLPYWILQITLLNDEPFKAHGPFMIICFHITSFLSYANSAINPVLYTFLSDNFKSSFREAFPCMRNFQYTRGKKSATMGMRTRKGESMNGNRNHNTNIQILGGREGSQPAGGSIEENRLSASSQNGQPLVPREDAFPERHSGSTLM